MIRQCANRKSAKYPDLKCALKATHGEFCFRHYKNPKRFETGIKEERRYSRKDELAVRKIQYFWKFWGHLHLAKLHGKSIFLREISQNCTEVTTMEDITSIPRMYFFSYIDDDKKLWSFDVRSLVGILSHHKLIENPYTRKEFGKHIMKKFYGVIDWLRVRKFSTMFSGDVELTEEQIWNQKVLDIFLKLDKLGFNTNLDWFYALNKEKHVRFYLELYNLWSRIALTKAQKEAIVGKNIFKAAPDHVIAKNHDLRWWQEETLHLINSFITTGAEYSLRTSGALYIIRCLSIVSYSYAEAYDWVLG